jgi:DNA-binding CsgD family transcriptional regulator
MGHDWTRAVEAAGELTEAAAWRASLARVVSEIVDAQFVAVVTCPPGRWAPQFDVHPAKYAALMRGIVRFLPSVERAGEGWSVAQARFGVLYAPLLSTQHAELRHRFRREILDPAGINGYVVAHLVHESRFYGAMCLGSRERCEGLLERVVPRLERVTRAAAATLHRAVQMASACGLLVPVLPEESWSDLTGRELEIMGLVASGLTNLNIGSRLGIAENTVAVHVRRIFSKLKIHSRSELTRLYVERRLFVQG